VLTNTTKHKETIIHERFRQKLSSSGARQQKQKNKKQKQKGRRKQRKRQEGANVYNAYNLIFTTLTFTT